MPAAFAFMITWIFAKAESTKGVETSEQGSSETSLTLYNVALSHKCFKRLDSHFSCVGIKGALKCEHPHT